jgi:hypothetical protein
MVHARFAAFSALIWGLACATTGSSSFPVVPPTYYDQMGQLVRQEYDVVKAGQGWWVYLPADQGQEIIVDVITTRPADIFLMDASGIEAYKNLMRSGGGSANTHYGKKYVQHYTQSFVRPDAREWWVLVDNSTFPDSGASSPALAARIRVYHPASRKQQPYTAPAAPAAAASTAPPEAFDGIWRGTTSQSHPIYFKVVSGAVVAIAPTVAAAGGRCEVETSCAEGKPCGDLAAPAAINNGTFSLSHTSTSWGAVMRGTFTSPTTASGELTFSLPASGNCPSMSGNVTWSATKR